MKFCECNCGSPIPEINKLGQPARFMRGHNLQPPADIGHRIKNNGYVLIKTEEGYRREHRVVMENELGRRLSEEEMVHHIDRNKENNSMRNLEIHSPTQHKEIHRIERHIALGIDDRICSVCLSSRTYWDSHGNDAIWKRSKITGEWLCGKCYTREWRAINNVYRK